MSAKVDADARSSGHAWARALSIVPISVGILVLTGWAFDVQVLKTVLPGWVTLKANTAVSFLLGGIGLEAYALFSREPRDSRRWVGTACGVLVATIGALTLLEYSTGRSLGIDELVFREPMIGAGTSAPGRMAPNSAFDFVLIGAALVLIGSRAARPRATAQVLALMASLVAMLALVGYLFDANMLVTVASRTRMAILTIAGFLALCGGIVVLTRDVGPSAPFHGPGLGGRFGRPLLLASTVVPIAIGFVMLLGQRIGLWDAAFQGAVVAVLSILAVDIVIWRSARSLDQIDAERSTVLVELRRLLKTHDDFLSVASHELKTPLTVLKLKVQSLLRKRSSVTPEKILSELGDARRQIDRLTSLMEMMLDVTRVESGDLGLETERIDLAEVARTVGARYLDDALRAKTTLVVRAPETLVGHWDRTRIDQVLSHLIRNAITHCEGSEVVVEVEAQTDEARGAQPEACIRVRDRGCGIAPEDQTRIFGRFERASSARHFGGLGLGLWLSQAIVKAHGGTLRVESAPKEGSVFEVRLPLTNDGEATQASGKSA